MLAAEIVVGLVAFALVASTYLTKKAPEARQTLRGQTHRGDISNEHHGY